MPKKRTNNLCRNGHTVIGNDPCKACHREARERYNRRQGVVPRKSPLERLMASTKKTRGCWRWTGYINKAGYGRISFSGTHMTVQRASYELLVGPIPPGYEIHHECRNKVCVNPKHLVAVTPQEHKQIHSAEKSAWMAAKNKSRSKRSAA